MKSVVVLLVFLLSLSCSAQEYRSEVVFVDSSTAQQLFGRATIAYTVIFKSANDAVDGIDQGEKIIIAKGTFNAKPMLIGGYKYFFSFTMTTSCKDGRYKYSIDDLDYNYQAGTETRLIQTNYSSEKCKGLTGKQWEKVKAVAKSTVESIVQELKNQMSKTENW